MTEQNPAVVGLNPNILARILILQTSLATIIKHLELTDCIKSELRRLEPVVPESLPSEVRSVPAPELQETFQQEIDYFVMMLDSPAPPSK